MSTHSTLAFTEGLRQFTGPRMEVLIDRAHYYETACEFLNPERDTHDLGLRGLMERRIKYVKERIEDFDNTYRAKGRCCRKHAEMLLSSIGSVLDGICRVSTLTSRSS
jgi:transposase-like protein